MKSRWNSGNGARLFEPQNSGRVEFFFVLIHLGEATAGRRLALLIGLNGAMSISPTFERLAAPNRNKSGSDCLTNQKMKPTGLYHYLTTRFVLVSAGISLI